MKPQLALIATILLISIAFMIDRRKLNFSLALWIPLIWMFYCGSRPIGYWLNPEGVLKSGIDYTEGSAIDRLFLSILIIAGVVILSRRDVGEIIRKNRLIFGLFLYMGISIFWSDFMEVSLKRWIRVVGDLIMVLIILTEPDAVQAIKSIFRRCGFVLIPLSVLFVKYYRHIGVQYDHFGRESWVGLTLQKNSLGEICFLIGYFLFWILLTKYREKQLFSDKAQLSVDLLLLILTLWLLNGSGTMMSATAFLMFIFGALCLIVLMKLKPNPNRIGLTVVVFLIVFLSGELLVNLFFDVSLQTAILGALGRDSTLTGRTDIWEETMKIAAKHPWFGVGYGGFWIGNLAHNLWDKFDWGPRTGHNGYLDVYVELGAVGLFLLMLMIIVAYWNIMKTLSVNLAFGIFKFVLWITICLYNFSESMFLKPTTLLGFIFLLIALNIPEKRITDSPGR